MSGERDEAATPFHKILIANRGEIALRMMRTRARAWLRRGRGLFRRRPRCAARARSRPGGAHRRGAAGAILSATSRRSSTRAQGERRRRGASGLRLPRRERGLRASLPRCGAGVHRAVAGGDRGDGQQGRRQATSCWTPACPACPATRATTRATPSCSRRRRSIGFPVMIKAVAGGGGRGMRLVRDAAGVSGCRCAARDRRRRARSATPTVILERAIVDPRHIEIQVFADRHGNAIHLGERDCSVQRRHQKLIEEAPSPAVVAGIARAHGRGRGRGGADRSAMRAPARWSSCSTASGEFYFMEMNTRLQVEHPVTEAITGLDLVELQLRVASRRAAGARAGGRPVPRPRHRGAAVRRGCRARFHAAERARMALWQMPDGIRVEHALQSGAEIPPFYDSMIAKIISHGADSRRGAGQADLRAGADRRASASPPTRGF